MTKSYQVLVNNRLYDRHVTFAGAKKHAAKLQASGMLAVTIAEVNS